MSRSKKTKTKRTPGPNERCTCGSNKKYKKCCMGLEQEKSQVLQSTLFALSDPTPMHNLDLREQNIALLETIHEVFGFRHARSWDDVKRAVTDPNIRTLYEFLAKLWPRDTDLSTILKHQDSRLRALYLGEIGLSPREFSQSICRFGLYSDEILIVCPFPNPWTMSPDFNPLLRPDRHLADTLKILHFFNLLTPWIKSGMVTIVPEPRDFDRGLNARIFKYAEAHESEVVHDQAEIDRLSRVAGEDVLREAVFISPEYVKERLIRPLMPNATEGEVEAKFDRVRAEVVADPLTLPGGYSPLRNQLMMFRSGTSLQSALRISDLCGAFPYTNLRSKWVQLLKVHGSLSEASKTWSPLTCAFHELDFRFLNNVDARFALRMREEGRLEGLRLYLRKLWGSLNAEPNPSRIDSMVRDFRDELHDAYRKAEDEWKSIDRDLVKWSAGTMATVGAVATGAAILTGGISLALPLITAGLSGFPPLVKSRFDRTSFRVKTPMSVFIDLSRHTPKPCG